LRSRPRAGLAQAFLETTPAGTAADDRPANRRNHSSFTKRDQGQDSWGFDSSRFSRRPTTIMPPKRSRGVYGRKAGADHVIRCVANESATGHRANSISRASPNAMTPTQSRAGYSNFRGKKRTNGPDRGQRGGSLPPLPYGWPAMTAICGQNMQVNGGLTLRRNPTARNRRGRCQGRRRATDASSDADVSAGVGANVDRQGAAPDVEVAASKAG